VGEARWLTVRAAGGRDLEVLVDGPDQWDSSTVPPRDAEWRRPSPAGRQRSGQARPPHCYLLAAGYASSTPQPGVLSRTSRKIRRPSSTHLELSASPRWLVWRRAPCPRLRSPPSQRDVWAAATIASVAPSASPVSTGFAGMGQENIDEFGAALKGEAAISEFLEKAAAGLRAVTGGEVAAALGGLVTEVDRNALTGEFAEVLAESSPISLDGHRRVAR